MNNFLIFALVLFLLGGVFGLYKQGIRQNNFTNNSRTLTNQENISNDGVPLPLDTDIINSFFGQIELKRPSAAVNMMSSNITRDNSQKQAWAVQFSAFDSLKIINVEPSMKEEWTDDRHSYKVILLVSMNPNSENQPIPYFGWENGENVRWINLVKENKMWRVESIATGP